MTKLYTTLRLKNILSIPFVDGFEHGCMIWTKNAMERINREIRRNMGGEHFPKRQVLFEMGYSDADENQ